MGKLAINGGKPVRTQDFPRWPIFDEREKKILIEVLESGKWGIGGKKVPEFSEKFAAMHGTRYGVSVVNGTAAIEISLTAAGIGGGDEVIVPAYTFLATASAVLFTSALPIFADIDPATYTIDPASLEKLITKRTKAIIPVHLGGQPADMDKIMEIAGKHHLLVVEDCAQAHLAEWRGKRVGSIGDLGTFSFQSSKNMTSGEGGIIISNNKDLAEKCWTYHNCGRTRGGVWYHHPYLGWNYRMTEFQAAILSVQMERLKEHSRIRVENARYLTTELSKITGIEPLKTDERVTVHAWHLYIFKYYKSKFDNLPRGVFLKALNAEGIPATSGYVPLYKENYLDEAKSRPAIYKTFGNEYDYKNLNLPNTEQACNEQAVWLTQNILLGDRKDMDSIVESVSKVKNNINELKS